MLLLVHLSIELYRFMQFASFAHLEREKEMSFSVRINELNILNPVSVNEREKKLNVTEFPSAFFFAWPKFARF